MTRRFSSLRPHWVLLLALFALLVACSDDKSSEQSNSSSPPSQDSAKSSPSANTTDQPTARYFANSKAVAPASVERPTPKGDLTFTLDIVEVKDKIARIRGWGFRLNPPHNRGDRATVLLVGASATYSALADVEMRPDVSSVLKQPGLDDTGFVSLIDITALPPGKYTIYLQLGGADGEAIKSTDRTLTL